MLDMPGAGWEGGAKVVRRSAARAFAASPCARGFAGTLIAVLVLGGAGAGPLVGQQSPAPSPGAAALPGGVPPAGKLTDASCATCHSLANLGYREAASGPVRAFTVAPAAFHASVHGRLSFRQCHADVDTFPHVAAQRRRVTCDQDCHAVDSAGRPYTHRSVVAQFRESVHGAVAPGASAPDPDGPSCLTCHGAGDAHAIAPAKTLTRPAKMALCVGCHDDRALMEKHRVTPDAVASYRRSFHYKSIRFGATGTAVCTDCHTAHHILPAADARSTVAPAALTETCGQSGCHAGAGRNFAVSGANHLDLRVERVPLLWFEEKFFYVLTAGTMLMLLVGIILDVQKKFGWMALAARAAGALARTLLGLRPSLVRSGRRGLRLARRILVD